MFIYNIQFQSKFQTMLLYSTWADFFFVFNDIRLIFILYYPLTTSFSNTYIL